MERGHTVDGAFDRTGSSRRTCQILRVPHFIAADPNAHLEEMRACCADRIGFSINNRKRLERSLLDCGIRFFGIHGGLVPQQRGRPEACVAFAILEGHAEYGVTLFELDAAFDSGPVLATERFPILPAHTFED